MSNVCKATDQMIEALVTSKEYIRMREAREKLELMPELCTRVDDFRGRNFTIQTGTDCDIEILEHLEADFRDVREVPVAAEFLAAELSFCRMIQSILDDVTASLEFV